MLESLNNPFDYPQSVIDEISLPLSSEDHCGDKIEIKIKTDFYAICVECGTVIKKQDLLNLIQNRGLDGDTQPIALQFLETHAIFRCDEEHEEEIHWSFQCLMKDTPSHVNDEEVYI